MSTEPGRFRSGRTVVFAIAAVFGGMLVVTTFATDLAPVEKALGALFYAGVGLSALGYVLNRRKPAPGGPWSPRPFAGEYLGRTVQGVAVPLRVANKGLLTVGMTVLGAAMLAAAAYILVTGEGVDGAVARVVAIVLLGLLGAPLFLGGIVARRKPRADAASLVLAPDALHLPVLVRREPLPWDRIAGFHRHVTNRAGAGMSPGGSYLRNDELIDVLGHDGDRLARIRVTDVPDPDQLLAALDLAWRDPTVRTALATEPAAAHLTTRTTST